VGFLILFWVLAPICVGSAVAMLFMRNPVHSALLLILNFFTIAIFFLMLGSSFLFVVQIIVYAGAIMVLFLFVIMLLGVDREETLRERIAGQRWVAVALGVALVAEVATAVRLGVGLSGTSPAITSTLNRGPGSVKALADVLFSSYFFPFEVTSFLLIVAAIGVMLLGRRHVGLPPTNGAGGEPDEGAPEDASELEPVT
jgi:NADH-quinone oxidoreductase subunit J